MVWGVVEDGRLVHVKGAGVQDLESKRPVTADTLFRIASMSKAFTALGDPEAARRGEARARRAGRDLRARAGGGRYPTEDSPGSPSATCSATPAGFVTDDPWGDRQRPLPEADSPECAGVPFSRAPATAIEYSASAMRCPAAS